MATLSLSSVRDMESARRLYEDIEKEEAKLEGELDKLLEQQTQMDIQISSFNQIIPNLESLQSSSQLLSGSISKASSLANTISHKVHSLDTAKRNVYSALKRVDDIIDLKTCVSGVKQTMDSGDFELAANHIRRYLDLDESVLLESAADGDRTDTVSGSFALLKEAEVRLRSIICAKLSEAIERRDKESIERFVKLFPLINLHEEGVDMLCDYLNRQIKEFSIEKLETSIRGSSQNVDTAGAKGNRAGVLYADILMSVYENIASKHDQYMPLLRTCYGVQWIVPFIRKIQAECDKQVEIILQHMAEDRMLEHKTQTIGIALNARHTAGAIRPDPRELDTLLTELSLCSSRSELYYKFVLKKTQLLLSQSLMCWRF
uniref:Conserved oligomeric Golgi complex subunit 4 n=1 Tax=Amphimedon queenslandica TaxID=400682 RepID=A0A1X7VEJ5_AMPQE